MRYSSGTRRSMKSAVLLQGCMYTIVAPVWRHDSKRSSPWLSHCAWLEFPRQWFVLLFQWCHNLLISSVLRSHLNRWGEVTERGGSKRSQYHTAALTTSSAEEESFTYQGCTVEPGTTRPQARPCSWPAGLIKSHEHANEQLPNYRATASSSIGHKDWEDHSLAVIH